MNKDINWVEKNKKYYTKEQVKEYCDYLRAGVKGGYFDDDTCREIVDNENWDLVQRMIDMAELYADMTNEQGGDI